MRVAITTTEDRFEDVAQSFIEHGLEPVPLPCIRIRGEPDDVLASVREAARSAGAVLASSARAVEVVWPEGEGIEADFYVVGPATAAAVRSRGGVVRLQGSSGLRALARQVAPLALPRLVFPHADGTDLDGLEPLLAAGVDVLGRVVYHTDRLRPGDDDIDAVAFASPSAVDGWLSGRSLDGLVVAAIGPTTAAALVRRGVRVDVVPAHPGHDELAASLAASSNQNGRTR